MRLLLVEDDLPLLEQLGRQLTSHGYAVEKTDTGSEALFLGRELPLDIAIVDLGLPDISGMEVIRQLRAADKAFPILILTARGRWQEKVEGLEAGADDYLVKPFEREDLLITIEAKLRRLEEVQRPALERAEQLEEQLTRSERLALLGELAAEFAHEIKSPLSVITMQAALIQRQLGTENRQVAQDMARIIKQSKRIGEMAQNLLEYSRRAPLTREVTDIHQIIEESLTFTSYLLTKRGITVERHFDHSLPPISIDPSQMEQVFLNLIVNAAQATPYEGKLTVSTRRVGDEVHISFADTGCGIPAENLDKIFEPYFTTKPRGEGTGLGLYVCRNILTKHGGTIEVESEVDVGTTFTIKLPFSH